MKLPNLDQDTVYTKQQKGFNIINFGSKEDGNLHRKYPRLTLEDRLREKKAYLDRSSIYRF